MKIVEYLLNRLKENNATDIFGIPGGVVLDFLYTADRIEGITPYLSYHEQAAAFEAVGYAQVNHTLGVAYATRGPGFTNLITGIADAYAESVPVLFITGHSGKAVEHSMRFEKEQELDTVSMVRCITKYASVIDKAEDCWKIDKAINTALFGRKGPVLLDFSDEVWEKDVVNTIEIECEKKVDNKNSKDFSCFKRFLKEARRPVILVGDGIRQSGTYESLNILLNIAKMPVLSSRGSQDVAAGNEYYFGYIGSHGIRYANMIFDKADLVIALGNRLAFPIASETYKRSLEGKRLVQIEIESSEIKSSIPNLTSLVCNLDIAIDKLKNFNYHDYTSWIETCNIIKQELAHADINIIVSALSKKLQSITPDTVVVCDVGNNEFWTSRAYEFASVKNRILYSKSFGSLGCGLPKAIGATINTGRPILLIVGDQGLQINIQELQFVKQHNLPIEIVVVNNHASGMIEDREKKKYGYELHTTRETGYEPINIKDVVCAYGIRFRNIKLPTVSEITSSSYIPLEPCIPNGNKMYDMSPTLDELKIKYLEHL